MTSWTIITTKHTFFIAEGLAKNLKHWFADVKISLAMPDKFGGDMYIVLCPQQFTRHPPAERTIFFQLEQYSSPHWWTPQYKAILCDKKYCAAVFDYSTKNIDFLSEFGCKWPRVYHMPIGCIGNFRPGITLPKERDIDVLFYGSTNSPRRINLLNQLKTKFNVVVVSELFGNELYATLRRAKVIVNLHYQDNAVLETPRICECLSLGIPVVSESTTDMTEYPELANGVHFFSENDGGAMMATVEKILSSPPEHNIITSTVVESESKSKFYMDRFLLANGLIAQTDVEPWLPSGDLVLTMPEIPLRYNASGKIPGVTRFPGLRGPPGWIGCGRSYSHIGRNSKLGIMVVEDDVILPEDWSKKLTIVREYLKTTEWDIFSGFQVNLNKDANISDITSYKGMEFVHLDRMVSTVCNIYNSRALGELSKWNDHNLNAMFNTVDRFLENQKIKVITTNPFLTGHREDMESTLWNGNNGALYNDYKTATDMVFAEKILAFKNR